MPIAAMPPDCPPTLRRTTTVSMPVPSVADRGASAARIVTSSDSDGFVIVDRETGKPVVRPVSAMALGSTIRIDTALIPDDVRRAGSVRR